MKKLVLLVCVLLSVTALNAKGRMNSVKDVISKYSKVENVTKVNIGGFMMSLAKPFMDREDREAINEMNINGIDIIDLSDCSSAVKESFTADMRKVLGSESYNEYIPMIKVTENGQKTEILVKQSDDCVNEMLIFSTDKEDCCIISIRGNISMEEVDRMVAENNK